MWRYKWWVRTVSYDVEVKRGCFWMREYQRKKKHFDARMAAIHWVTKPGSKISLGRPCVWK